MFDAEKFVRHQFNGVAHIPIKDVINLVAGAVDKQMAEAKRDLVEVLQNARSFLHHHDDVSNVMRAEIDRVLSSWTKQK